MSSVSSLERIFFECLQKGTPEGRAAYLAEACAGDAALLRSLQKMLEAHDSSFLEEAAYVPSASAEEAGQRIGAYRLVEQLGEGGMGTVWLAEQLEPVQRQVALKLIKAGMDSRQVIARFEAERQALALMDHPNIARVLDGGADASGRPYFVMDLFAGVPITRYCDEQHLSVRERLELFAQVCEAIQHAHQKGVIHRDIKPSNVLVALQDGRAVPKVIDFGIAKAIEQKLGEHTVFTQAGGFLGTLEYMSPEQSAKSAGGVDTRSDIYSLGVLLYELLTGGTPLSRQLLDESSLADILRVISDGETPKPSTRLRETGATPVSGELDWIVMKALEKDRDRRYATAADLGQDVQRFLADEPVQAGPPSAAYRLRKFARRNRGALAAASVLVAAVLVAIGGVGWAVGDRAARKADAERIAADRRARVDATVQELLAAADKQMAAQAWFEALATVRRADAAATSGEADPQIAERVRVLLEDLEFVEELDRVRSRAATWTNSVFDNAGVVRGYAEAFREHGIDTDAATQEALIERLSTTPALAMPLAAGLEDLARRSFGEGKERDACLRLMLAANAIDPEPMRTSIRDAWGGSGVEVARVLINLARTIDVRLQPPATTARLASSLRVGLPALSDRLLRTAQQAHPGDFWLAFDLGNALNAEKDFAGALLYYTVAAAIRPDSAAAHNNLAHVLIERHDYAAGISSLQRAIELDPGMAAPHINMGRLLIQQQKPDEALAEIRRALDLDPRMPLAWIGLGTALLELKQHEQAVEAFQHAIELEPNNVHALGGLSDVLRAQGKLPEAIAEARLAIAADPKNARGYISLGNALGEKGDRAASIEAFRRAIELDPTDAVPCTNLGGNLAESKDHSQLAEALALSRRALELEPDYALGHFGLGNVLLLDGQNDAALAAFRRAVELAPNLDRAHFMIGQILFQQEHLDEALAAFQRTLALRPGHDGAWFLAGRVHLLHNELDDAEAALRKAIEINPRHADAYHGLAGVLSKRNKPDEALAANRRAAEIQPDDAMRQMAVAASLYGMKRYDEEIAVCRKAIELDPGCRVAYVMLGLALRLQDKFGEAIGPLEEAIRLDPRDPSITGVLAMLLVTCPDPKLNNPPRALELARKAIELQPGVASHSRTLGVALYRTGQWQEALAALELVSERDPERTGFDAFFVAMAHQQLGDAAAARAAYDRGSEKFERTHAYDQDTRRVRDEAASLLGIER